MLKLAEIKEMSKEEITGQLDKSKKELVELRMKFASRQLEDVSQIRKKRKEITRLHTLRTMKLSGKDQPVVKEEKKSVKLIKPKKEKKAKKEEKE